jgi:DNA end-binding protein Ku
LTGRKSGDQDSGLQEVRGSERKSGKKSGPAGDTGRRSEIIPGNEHGDDEITPGKEPSNTPGMKTGRPIWSGNLTIGLVNVPVRLHTMVRDRSFSFRLLHREDGQPLRYERVCTRDGRVVPWQDTVRGYEVRKGEYVVIEPEELKAFLPESDRKIRIQKFVYYLALDPVYFETPYVLTPDRSEEAYGLLVTALQELGRAAVGTITLRTKEYPVVVHVYQGGLVLTTLRYADEVTVPKAFGELSLLPQPKDAELTLAKRIISDLSGSFSITDYRDTFRDSVEALVKKKIAGEKVVYEKPHPEEAKELMDALQETLVALAKK